MASVAAGGARDGFVRRVERGFITEEMHDPDSRPIMLGIADDHENLAKRAQDRRSRGQREVRG